jgi:membrane fusion protein (multidrug efflux system)
MKRWIAVALIALVAAGAWFGFKSDGKPAAPAAVPGMPVEAEKVTTSALSREIIAVGSLRADESVIVSAEVAGRVTRIAFEEGGRVEKGALLFELDDAINRAEVEAARAAIALSESNYKRSLGLYEKKLISASQRDEILSRRAADRAALALAEARLAKTHIVAPFGGIAGLRQVSPGDYVKEGQALVNLEALDVMKADFRLSEAALPHVQVGQKLALEVDAWPGESFTGEVYAIDPRLADETRAVAVRARVPNAKGQLRSGLFARVRLIVGEKPDAILISEQAIVPEGQKQFVYVIEGGKAAMREVTVGQRRPGKVEIVKGLQPGELVITAGLQKIGPGAPVTPVNLGQPQAPAMDGGSAARGRTPKPPKANGKGS